MEGVKAVREQRRTVAHRPTPSIPPPTAADRHPVLRLQRQAGNMAVRELLSSAKDRTPNEPALLAHEVTHVLQQRGDVSGSAPARLEGQAARAARSGDAPVTVRERGRAGLARAEAPGPVVATVDQGQSSIITVDSVALLECTAPGEGDAPVFTWRVAGTKGGPLVLLVVHVAATTVTVYPEGKQWLREHGYTDVRVVDSVLREARPSDTPAAAPAPPPRRGAGTRPKPASPRKPPAQPQPAQPQSAQPRPTEEQPAEQQPAQPQPADETPAQPPEEPPGPGADITPPAPDASVQDGQPPATGPPPPSPPLAPGPAPAQTAKEPGPSPAGSQSQQATTAPGPAPFTTPAPPAGAGKALVDEFSGWLTLDERGLGARLAGHARNGQLAIIDDALNQVGSTDRDDVSLALVSQLSAPELDALLTTREGKALSLRLYDELTSGYAGADEQAQAKRLLDARFRSAKPGAALDPAMKVIPFEGIGFTKLESASLSAQRLPDGRISVRSHLTSDRDRRYAQNLSPAFLAGLPETFNPDEVIGIYLVDEDRLVTAPAMFLLELSNQETTKAYSMIGQAVFTGLTLGAGAEVSAAEAGAESAVARTGVARLLAGGARVAAAADRVAVVIGTAGVLIDDHRGLIIRTFGDRGREGLEIWSKVETITAVYGVARGGAALVQLAARMRTALASWRALRAAARDQSPGEAQALDATIRETEAALRKIEYGAAESTAGPARSAAPAPRERPDVPRLPGRQRQALGFGAENDNALPLELSAQDAELIDAELPNQATQQAANTNDLRIAASGGSGPGGGGSRRATRTPGPYPAARNPAAPAGRRPAPPASTQGLEEYQGRVIRRAPGSGQSPPGSSAAPPSPLVEAEEGLTETEQEFRETQNMVTDKAVASDMAKEGQSSFRDRIQPQHLADGVVAEEVEKLKCGLDLSKETTWRPGEKDINSVLFEVMVGEPEYTDGKQLRGVIMDGPGLEIKSGSSQLQSTYQLRLMAYRAVISDRPLTIVTSRHIEPEFRAWLTRWSVDVRPFTK
jgi:hypothetical protein